MLAAFLMALGGCPPFRFPAPRFSTSPWPSLFLIGIGMAMLQVAINPLLRVAGGEEQFRPLTPSSPSWFSAWPRSLSPKVYSYLVAQPSRVFGAG